MSDFDRGYSRPDAIVQPDMAVDAGLRAFMLGVYNKLALGLLLSAGLAYLTSHAPVSAYLYQLSPSGRLEGFTLFGMILRFAPLVVILLSGFLLKNPSPAMAGALYWGIVSLIGAGLGLWLLVFQTSSVFMMFLITATAFGALSLFGYATKRDLSGMGSFLIMGLFGLIAASLANMFLHLPMLAWVVNIVGVLIFAGLIAFDTQRLKLTYYQLGGNTASMAVATNYGALNLYINFINMFQFLLSMFGSRR